MVLEVTDATFETEVLKSEKPVLVDFWAPWCGPCRILSPRVDELSREMQQVKFCKLETDNNQGTASRFGIMSIPTLILFKNGQAIDQVVGAVPKDFLMQWLLQRI